MHKSFLCKASPFFRAALQGSNIISLPQDKSATFDRFLGWLYWKEYDIKDLTIGKSDIDCWSAIIHDHIFADKVQVEGFQNRIMDVIVASYKTGKLKAINLDSVLEIYKNTPESCPLRSFAVAMYECISDEWLEKVPQFAAQLLRKLAESGRAYKKIHSLRAEDFYGKRNSNADATSGGIVKS